MSISLDDNAVPAVGWIQVQQACMFGGEMHSYFLDMLYISDSYWEQPSVRFPENLGRKLWDSSIKITTKVILVMREKKNINVTNCVMRFNLFWLENLLILSSNSELILREGGSKEVLKNRVT